jgi:hypothetical protein
MFVSVRYESERYVKRCQDQSQTAGNNKKRNTTHLDRGKALGTALILCVYCKDHDLDPDDNEKSF